jgi:SAM-dependent methyltransferase
MYKERELPQANNLVNHQAAMSTIADHIKQKASFNGALNILEAGCGRRWRLNLEEVEYTLTGVDLDRNALDIRKNQHKDLDVAILGDLRTVSLEENNYDIVFCENVLEHIDGAEDVLKCFVRWLKPSGIMILVFPNRDSAYGFATRITPFWVHVFYKKHIQGIKNAGKPGHDPYPVSFDKVVSRNGIYEFCERHGLIIKAEYRMDGRPMKSRNVWFLTQILLWGLYLISFKRLSVNYRSLMYIIEKPQK